MGNPVETEGNWEKPGKMERVREENQGEIERNRGKKGNPKKNRESGK